MHKTVIVDEPGVEPVSLTEAKAHLNVTSSSKDAYITALITASRIAVERYLNRALVTQNWKVYYTRWEECLKIPFPPLQDVTSLKFFDNNGASQTLAQNSYYWVVSSEDPAYIRKKYNAVYPILDYGRPDAIEIAFTAGYGDAATDVPEPIRLGIKLMLTKYYEHRSDVVVGPQQVNLIPNHVADMIHSYRIYQF